MSHCCFQLGWSWPLLKHCDSDPDVPSSVPENVSVLVNSSRSFFLSWYPPAPETRNGNITRYTISVLEVDTLVRSLVFTTQHSLQFPTSTFAVMPYRSYVLQVAAETVAGRGPYSTDVTARTPEDSPTHFPQNLVGEVLNSSSFRLRWNPPPQEHHNGEIREYRVNVTEIQSGRVLRFSTPHTELVVSGLHPYFPYECAVTAVTVNEGPYSAAIGVRTHEAAPSAPPQNISATVGTTSISLSWIKPGANDRNGEIRSYTITFVRADTGAQRTRNSGSESATLFGLEPFTTYTIRVAAYTVAIGPFSSALRVTTLEDVPGPPQNVALQATDPTTLRATWLAPDESNRNGIILGYQLTLRGTQSTQFRAQNTSSLVFVWSGLHPYYSYSASIAAATSVGHGTSVNTPIIQMPEAAPSSSPLNVTLTNNSPTSVSVTWAYPPTEDHNGIIRRFRLVLVESQGRRRRWTRNTTSTNFLFDFLEENYNYTLIVAADTVAVGPYSQPLNFTTLPDRPAEGPLNLAVRALDATTVSAMWDLPPFASRNGDILRYVINITRVTGRETQVLTSQSNSLVTRSLHPYYSYFYSVAAENSVGRGPPSTLTLQMPEAPPTGPPQRLAARSLDPRTLELSWGAPTAELQNGLIRQYHVVVHTQGVVAAWEMNYTTTANRLVIEDLHPHYTYQCLITALTVGAGPSATVSSQLPQDAPDIAPVNFKATRRGSQASSVLLTWAAIPLQHRNGILTGYAVTAVASFGSDEPREVTVEPELVLFEWTDLTPDTQYNISIAALTVAGRGPIATAQVTLLPRVPSAAPTVGEIIRTSATEIQVQWSALSSDNTEAATYLVRYRPLQSVQKRNADDLSTIVETNRTSFVISELDPRFAYAVSVAARNRGGVGNYSQEVTIELFDSSIFKIHYTGAIVCVPWLTHDRQVKLGAVLNTIITELTTTCSCRLSAKYIAGGTLMCGDRTTDRVILRGTLIGTRESDSGDLHTQLQAWVDESPTVEVNGIPLQIVPCSTYLGGEASCDIQEPNSTATTFVRVVDQTEASSAALGGVTLYAAVGGGVALVLIVVLVIGVLVVVIRKRRRSKKYETNRNRNMHIGMNVGPVINPMSINNCDVKETELDDVKFEDSEHIYDDPNQLMGTSSLKIPLPATPGSYATLNRDSERDAKPLSSGACNLQPPAPETGKGQNLPTYDEARYTQLYQQPTNNTPIGASLTTKIAPPQAPPGYSTPKPSMIPGRSAPKPPGYAVPKPQATSAKVDLAENMPKGADTVYFPLMNRRKMEERNAYQGLLSVQTERKRGEKAGGETEESEAYQELSSVQTNSKCVGEVTTGPTGNHTQQEVHGRPAIEEEEEYTVMNSPLEKTPAFSD